MDAALRRFERSFGLVTGGGLGNGRRPGDWRRKGLDVGNRPDLGTGERVAGGQPCAPTCPIHTLDADQLEQQAQEVTAAHDLTPPPDRP